MNDFVELVTLLLARHESPQSIGKILRTKYSVSLTKEQINQISIEHKEDIEELRQAPATQLKLIRKYNILPFVDPLTRIAAFSQIVKMGKDGYQEDRVTKQGVVQITSYNLLAANKALESIKDEVLTIENSTSTKGDKVLQVSVNLQTFDNLDSGIPHRPEFEQEEDG